MAKAEISPDDVNNTVKTWADKAREWMEEAAKFGLGAKSAFDAFYAAFFGTSHGFGAAPPLSDEAQKSLDEHVAAAKA